MTAFPGHRQSREAAVCNGLPLLYSQRGKDSPQKGLVYLADGDPMLSIAAFPRHHKGRNSLWNHGAGVPRPLEKHPDHNQIESDHGAWVDWGWRKRNRGWIKLTSVFLDFPLPKLQKEIPRFERLSFLAKVNEGGNHLLIL